MPERTRRSHVRTVDRAGGFEATWRTGTSGIGCFMSFWLAGWSFGCGLMTSVAVRDPQLLNLIGAAIVWTGWLVGAVVLVGQFFGRERIVLSADGAQVTAGAFFRTRTRTPLAEIERFGTAAESEGGGNDRSIKKLELRTLGRPIRFGAGLTTDEIRDVAEALNERLTKLRKASTVRSAYPQRAECLVFRRPLVGELPLDERPLRRPSDPPLEPPSDTKLRLVDLFDGARFVGRGRLSFGGVVGMLLLNVFWNGIVSLFLVELWGDGPERPRGIEWLYRFLLLLPFEAVGLAMLVGLLLVIVEPARRWTRTFATNYVRDDLTWFRLVGWRKRVEFRALDRIEVRKVPYDVPRFPRRLPLGSLWAPEGCPTYSVVPIDSNGRDVHAFEGFTFAEACWMADVALRRATI